MKLRPLPFLPTRFVARCAFALAAVAVAGHPMAAPHATRAVAHHPPAKASASTAPAAVREGQAEARLIEVYRLVGAGQVRQALERAEALVRDHPNFQLAQLVYGDLLTAHVRPLRTWGDVPDGLGTSGSQALADLREESLLRLRALRERPPAGAVPSQFLQVSPRSKHAIAVDTSRARLYLFENTPAGLKLVSDYYISVGKLGTDKAIEGDLRTPLGVYYVTSNLDPRSLKDFYGAGALPINYPNPYDARRGKTGGGIWLHGTPPAQYSRPPKATDGCVVLANPDLESILRSIEVRSTPVVIAPSLRWVPQANLQAEGHSFADALASWRAARTSGDIRRVSAFYTSDFTTPAGKTMADWMPQLKLELEHTRGRELDLKDLSYLRWTDSADTMVVTFGEVPAGARTGPIKRQYWMRQGPQWKIFFEGVIG